MTWFSFFIGCITGFFGCIAFAVILVMLAKRDEQENSEFEGI